MLIEEIKVGSVYRWIEAPVDTAQLDHEVDDIVDCSGVTVVSYQTSLNGQQLSGYVLPLADFARLMQPRK